MGCAAVIGLTVTGCIRSRVTITSEPTWAEVYFQRKPRGVKPVTHPLTWYWYYDSRIEKEGYETVEAIERLRSPPWFILPFDIFAEIIPIPISDHRYRHYALKQLPETP